MNNLSHSRNLGACARAGHFLAVFLLAGLLGASLTPAADLADSNTSGSIPWNQIGAKAGANYQGDGLAVTPTESGARLHCVFQRLDGEATSEGLWLTSTVTNTVSDRFRVTAIEVGRVGERGASERQSVEPSLHAPLSDAPTLSRSHALPESGTVVIDSQTARFSRPGLTEEYSVSMDGVRQDFIVEQAPASPPGGELVVRLAVAGAQVEPAADGARLVLANSGRKIAYSRLRVTDATGKELAARIEVVSVGVRPSSGAASRVGLRSASLSDASRLLDVAAPEDGRTPGLLVLVNDADAVYPVRIDPTFSDANWVSMGGLPGANGGVSAAVIDGSGNLYIGGNFTVVGNTLAANVAEWNGSSWSPLGSGLNGSVSALAVSGSTVYAGGSFTNAGGSAPANIAQWNGTSWSPLGSGMSGEYSYGTDLSYVAALAVSGGTLYAGGYFTNAGGSAANDIAQWDGSSWSPLGSGMGGGSYPSVHALAVSGGTLYAGGAFTTAGDIAATNIAQWNGTAWSALGSGIGDEYSGVRALAVSGSMLYAGGYFTTAGGSAATNIAQWNGSSWSALGSGMGAGYAAVYVFALAVSGGTLYAGGQFTSAGGNAANNIAQWNGSSWSPLGSGMPGGDVFALAVSGGTLYAGGQFTSAGGSAANSIAQWNGSSWSALGSGINGLNSDVYALAVSGSTLYAGGQFTTAGGSVANYIAQWNGSSWSALGSGMDNTVYALAVSGGTLFAGGQFTTAGGSAANDIAQWNGSSWSALGSGLGPNYASVYALAVSGGTLYVGGIFTTAGGSAANYVAQWNGSSWSPLGSGMSGGNGNPPSVNALAVSGSTLYAGGGFTYAGGSAANYIAQWNGTSWSALGSGMNSVVRALAVSGGTLYAGGGFTNAGGSAANNIAQWNGSSWSALGSGISGVGDKGLGPYVLALALSGDTLFAGGEFATAGGSAANSIAQWNGTSWSALGSGMSGGYGVAVLAVSGSTLYAGGNFTTAGGKVSASVAEAYLVAPPGGLVDSIVVPSSGTADVRCYGNPGQQFGVQRTRNLAPPLWTNVNSSPLIPAADGSFTFADTNAPPGAAFYRAFQY